ncbi:MAG: recombination protein RecR [Candidatus Taylorbacteria bacterium]|nr:recombination protein RecR [Candidatus Taylorbacteria bacterium]
MDPLNKLIEYFSEFPGIGPRQAKRFAYFLLTKNGSFLESLTKNITELKQSIKSCSECFRYFTKDKKDGILCTICNNSNRDQSTLIIVSRDVDLETIEKSHSSNGKYFVLGGSVPILEKNPETRIRSKELINYINRNKEKIKEIILALNANSEGENTADYLKSILSPIALECNIKISILGRGLSTGTELEYSDSDTITNALRNRY